MEERGDKDVHWSTYVGWFVLSEATSDPPRAHGDTDRIKDMDTLT